MIVFLFFSFFFVILTKNKQQLPRMNANINNSKGGSSQLLHQI
jgi:hypothetical protein